MTESLFSMNYPFNKVKTSLKVPEKHCNVYIIQNQSYNDSIIHQNTITYEQIR